ncbi:MAG: NUDIX hydrolase [Pseudomonadota bacterium]
MIRRIGEPPQSGVTYTRRIGVYAILPRDGDLLVTFQGEPDNELQLPGGGVDPGEQHMPALHREVLEETGWIIAAPRRLGAFRRFVYMPEYHRMADKICIIYAAHPVRRLGPPLEAGHTELWISPQVAVETLGNPGDRHFIRQYLNQL